MRVNTILRGDALEVLRTLPDEAVHCVVTSPPYWGLRDYGCAGQIGLEPTPQEYLERMVEVFREIRRVLRKDGTAWVNMGDSYSNGGAQITGYNDPAWIKTGGKCNGGPRAAAGKSGLKPKDLCGIPWRLALALQEDGWWLRSEIIWSKPNPMPSSVKDRPTVAHETIFLLTKSQRYFYDHEGVKEPAVYVGLSGQDASGYKDAAQYNGKHSRRKQDALGKSTYTGFNARWKSREPTTTRSLRSVWTIATHPFPEAHFATFPPRLAETCIKAGCPVGGVVLDPFAGAGTTCMVAAKLGRAYLGIELNPEYAAMAERRISQSAGLLLAAGESS